ncbi:MAG: TonB family protein [Ignavibacteriota bacterium]
MTADTVRLEGTESAKVDSSAVRQDSTGTFVLEHATGGRMRLEVSTGNSRMLQIADGENLWSYLSVTQTYTKVPHSTGAMGDAYDRLKFSRDSTTFGDAKIDREESLAFGGHMVPCFVVEAAYKSLPGNPAAREVTRTVWIAKNDDRILRDIWDFSLNPGGAADPTKARITDEFKVIESAMTLADDRFVFTPPVGSREISVGAPAGAQARTVTGRAAPIREIKPEYTAEARSAGLQGTVSLYVETDTQGHPSTVQVMQGLGFGLDEKAIDAVKQSQYSGAGLQALYVQFRLDSPGPWSVAAEAYTVTIPEGQRVSEVVKPVPSKYVAPDPSACQSAGNVALRLIVGANGEPRDVKAVPEQSSPLAAAAVKAVEAWQFVPAALDGQATEAYAEVELECHPNGMVLQSERPTEPVYKVGNGVSVPVLLSKVEPEYSEAARQAKYQGSNQLYVQITPEGKPAVMRVTRSLGLGLDEKAMEAVLRWRFKPSTKDGKPVTVEANIEVNFRLL